MTCQKSMLRAVGRTRSRASSRPAGFTSRGAIAQEREAQVRPPVAQLLDVVRHAVARQLRVVARRLTVAEREQRLAVVAVQRDRSTESHAEVPFHLGRALAWSSRRPRNWFFHRHARAIERYADRLRLLRDLPLLDETVLDVGVMFDPETSDQVRYALEVGPRVGQARVANVPPTTRLPFARTTAACTAPVAGLPMTSQSPIRTGPHQHLTRRGRRPRVPLQPAATHVAVAGNNVPKP